MSTYTPISTQTLSANAASVTFSGIPQTYTDLVLVGAVGSTSTSFDRGMRLQFNGDTTSLYSDTDIYGEASTAASFRRSSQTQTTVLEAIARSGNYSAYTINIMNYANTTTNKTVIARGGTTNLISASVGLWRSTAAINSITINLNSDNIASGSTFTLYGIGAGSPKAFGGDEVRTDGTYWYHTYRSSGIFAPMQNLTCDYLVVAGGGAGGSTYAGGGGAGGLRSSVTSTGGGGSLESALALNAGNSYTVTIGAGGVQETGAGGRGNNSVFATITSTGGGGGAGYSGSAYESSLTGGSGGGGAMGGPHSQNNGAAGTTNQGYAGGNGQAAGYGGGGGGAGVVGVNATTSAGGAGGAGVSFSITGSSVTYAGGGGGGGELSNAGAGGSGGGGAGTTGTNTATSGTANTGGGGGGGAQGSTQLRGGAGGSGIVIVRYAV